MSFKSLAAEGHIKKTDLFRVRLEDLKVEKGFNLRDTLTEDSQAHIKGMLDSFMSGVTMPPLEVRADDDDNIYIVDGHCRTEMYKLAKAAGADVEWINVVAFRGNDQDRVAKMIASSQGKALTPLETALGYKRLRAFGMEPAEIAKKVGKSSERIRQLLILADANADVHQAVKRGDVSSDVAIEIVQKQGELAGEHIAKLLDKAKLLGKKKVTNASATKSVPRKVVDDIACSIHKQMQAQSGGAFFVKGHETYEVRLTGDQISLLCLGLK